MKKLIPVLALLSLVFCKKDDSRQKKMDLSENMRIDSINAARIKHNEQIKALNSKNLFRDLSGSHRLTHNLISNSGEVLLKKIGRDLYFISGEAKAGKDYVKIEGEINMISQDYLNFEGQITQSIAENENGKLDLRKKKTSFAKKGNSNYFRLQNMTNSQGFIDYIDLYLK
ncbi:hypothetical protein [Chryseobacterium sp. MP_3.2]|uniref:hypothetical protein n=1 Tax=Chryseobacterium sp. MP_3.2 TaxID=3071712 RepID=UPI002E015795|nr:hypothetical protein [Chryseobacterium sp. MP_3.2]